MITGVIHTPSSEAKYIIEVFCKFILDPYDKKNLFDDVSEELNYLVEDKKLNLVSCDHPLLARIEYVVDQYTMRQQLHDDITNYTNGEICKTESVGDLGLFVEQYQILNNQIDQVLFCVYDVIGDKLSYLIATSAGRVINILSNSPLVFDITETIDTKRIIISDLEIALYILAVKQSPNHYTIKMLALAASKLADIRRSI